MKGPLAAWSQSRPPVIAGYHPIASEIDTGPLLRALNQKGYKLALPVTGADNGALEFRHWNPGDALMPDAAGVPSPPPGAQALTPDIVMVPALAFDRAGHRLGYGRGHYDLALRRLRNGAGIVAVTLAYAAQEVPIIEAEPHDEAADWIVTEQFARAQGVASAAGLAKSAPPDA